MIPRTIHQVWLGPAMPDHLAAWCDRWRELHPDWDYKLWREADVDTLDLVNRSVYDAADHFAAGNGVWQLRADVVRYEILEQHGGVYADVDMEPRRPLDPLLPDDVACFAAWEVDGQWINNAVMGAEPGHPLMAALVARLHGHLGNTLRRLHYARPNVLTGPQFLTAIRASMPDVDGTVFPARLFYPYLYHELHRDGEAFPDAYAVHHWNNRRITNARRRRDTRPPLAP